MSRRQIGSYDEAMQNHAAAGGDTISHISDQPHIPAASAPAEAAESTSRIRKIAEKIGLLAVINSLTDRYEGMIRSWEDADTKRSMQESVRRVDELRNQPIDPKYSRAAAAALQEMQSSNLGVNGQPDDNS